MMAAAVTVSPLTFFIKDKIGGNILHGRKVFFDTVGCPNDADRGVEVSHETLQPSFIGIAIAPFGPADGDDVQPVGAAVI